MSGLGERILDACLRRVRSPEWAGHDVVLVREHPALGELPAMCTLVGEVWRVERVSGELTLRDALPDAGRLVAIVPAAFLPPPDIAGRAWLNKPLDVRADDVVSGVTGRPCEPLVDDELATAVVESLDLLTAEMARWSQHGAVSPAEVRAVLVATDLGTDERLDRERDHVLLARWIIEGAPRSRVPALLGRALEESIPRTGRWLAWVATTGNVPSLLAAGGVGPDASGDWGIEPVPRTWPDKQELRGLVDRAVRDAWRMDEGRTIAALQHAERRAHTLRAVEDEPTRFPLVRAALDRALFHFARRAVAGDPADDAAVDSLRANLYGPRERDTILHVRDLGRIARALEQRPPDGGVEEWAAFGGATVGWLDRAVRDVRRRTEGLPEDLRGPSELLVHRALERRDAWNRAFAEELARDWTKVAGARDLRRPLPLHQVTRGLIPRLVADGARVLLVVLDGCDLSTFFELADTLPDDVGLALPPITDANLRGDLASGGALRVAVAPVPTVTSHARRALFAGDIPGSSALDDTESPAANATGDRQAFARNPGLKDMPRALLLKGDLADGGLEAALARTDLRLVAVVWNGVDDALSSKETTALGPWEVSALGVRAAEALRRALEGGWTVLVTADHGHTPYVEPGRKAAASAQGTRHHTAPLPGAVRFSEGPLPNVPLHLLTDVGAWAGNQHRGFHGGAGLEEVLVPLAFLGTNGARPRPPAWWWSREDAELTPRDAEGVGDAGNAGPAMAAPPSAPLAAAPSPAKPADADVPPEIRALFAAQPTRIAALERLAEHRVLTVAQLARLLGTNPYLVTTMMSTIQGDLARANLPVPLTQEESAGERVYRWRRSG